ncbi:MAG TPA: pseudouridine synthase [Gaiellales bacterium]
MPVRLNRFLAAGGLGSRRAVEALIRDGRVTVNGQPAGLAASVEDGDDVRVDGSQVTAQRLETVLLHKPMGVVTTVRDPQGRRTVLDLVDSPLRLFPVGRLDRETTGALLLTNDGMLAHGLMHPRHGVDKTYVAEVEGTPSDEALERLRLGVQLDDGMTAPARVRRLDAARIELTIHEGRNRQVRRMCEAVGHPVSALHRSSYAGLTVDGLHPGAWRTLGPAEVERLRAHVLDAT